MSEIANRVRGLLGAARSGRSSALERIELRLDKQATRFNHQRDRLDRQGERLDRQRSRIDKLARTQGQLRDRLRKHVEMVAKLEDRFGDLDKSDKLRELDFRRAMQQLASAETRLARLEQQIADPDLAVEDGSAAQAHSLVDQIRREHDQVRARFQVISGYEERIRRLEAAVSPLHTGDARYPL